MKKQKAEKEKFEKENWHISVKPIIKQNVLFCMLILVILSLGMVMLSFDRMKNTASASLRSTRAQISQRLGDTKNLLEALAVLPEFYDPDYDPIEKAGKLDQIKEYYHFCDMCYVDSDMIVYSDMKPSTSLASRDYLKRLFATGEYQITDSFPVWADGSTLNYTVAVPLKTPQGEVTGALLSAIYFDEIEQLLKDATQYIDSRLLLAGSKEQVMSSTFSPLYDKSIWDILEELYLIGATQDQIQETFLAGEGGAFWSIYNGSLQYTIFCEMDYADWNLICTVNFSNVFDELIPMMIFISLFFLLITIARTFMMRRDITKQSRTIDMLLRSVEELEKSLYHEEHPEHMDFHEIIQLTSKGLTDGLTGVVTRSVFLNQAATCLKSLNPEKVNVLCFVDLDNLKHINDTYGHAGGDTAIKSVGYVLREFEKRYDGVVGRYGGDEFVMLMTNLDSQEELDSVLDELVLRMKMDIGVNGQQYMIQCSVGASVYAPNKDIDKLIAEADEALYFVKQNGKGYYKIYRDVKTYEE